jgi:hypothetical protein
MNSGPTSLAACLLCVAAPAPPELAALQEPALDESGALAESSSLSDRALEHLRFDRALTSEEIDAALELLVQWAPDYALLETIGQSTGGRALSVLALTDLGTGPPVGKPACLVVDFLPAERSCVAESALALALRLVRSARADEGVKRLLGERTLYIAPALDPDVRAGSSEAAAARTSFDLNFPMGWQPASFRPGAGETPLSTRETLAVARFLDAHPNIAILCAPAPAAESDGTQRCEPSSAERAVYAALSAPAGTLGGPVLRGFFEGAPCGGSLLEYAWRARGIYALALRPCTPSDPRADEGARATWAELAARALVDQLECLPVLALEAGSLRPLDPGSWQLDLLVENRGRLLAAGPRAAGGAAPPLRFTVHGARLVALTVRTAADEVFRLQPAQPSGSFALAPLASGEQRTLRLFLEAPAESAVEIVGGAPWTGERRAAILLR